MAVATIFVAVDRLPLVRLLAPPVINESSAGAVVLDASVDPNVLERNEGRDSSAPPLREKEPSSRFCPPNCVEAAMVSMVETAASIRDCSARVSCDSGSSGFE